MTCSYLNSMTKEIRGTKKTKQKQTMIEFFIPKYKQSAKKFMG